MDIDDLVRERSGQDDLRIPADNGKWVRFNCPFCHTPGMKRKKTAALHYGLQWFMCFRCGQGFYSDDAHYRANDARLMRILDEHRDLIRRVTMNVKRKIGNWVTYNELHNRAEELMWGYVFLPPGNPHDAGMWDEWKNAADDDKTFNDRIANVLWGDLMNYADAQTKGARTHGITGIPEEAFDPELPDNSPLKFKMEELNPDTEEIFVGLRPRMRSTGTNDWWTDDLEDAENDAIPFTAPGCELQRNGLGPRKGHCPLCDMAFHRT